MNLPAVEETRPTPPTEMVGRCFLCGETATEPVLVPSRDRLHRLPGSWALLACAGCGLARLSPRPVLPEIGFYYPSDYCSFHGPAAEAGDAGGVASEASEASEARAAATPAGREGMLRGARTHVRNSVLAALGYLPRSEVPAPYRLAAPILRRLFHRRVFFGWRGFPEARPGTPRALDVGCGAGALLRLLQYHGWDVAGVELDPEAAAVARETTGREVFAGELHDAPFDDGSFDFVHLSHVVEHMADPTASLAAARRLLRPGGVMYVETPNVESANARRLGSYWIGYDSPRHLYLFSPATLRQLVEEAGFSVDRVKTWGFPGVFAWADTYRVEDDRGALLEGERPRLRASRRPRAAWLAARARVSRLRRADGDIIGLWARRPQGPTG